MTNSLENLLQEGVISEILSRLKSGKEADVFVVRQADKTIAAKVYKDHAHRSFKNNADYREGRSVRNSRSQRAIDSGSRFGKDAAEEAWKSAEANTLFKLHAAGVRVPTPVMFLEGVLLMELVLDADGAPASRLIDTQFDADLAAETYKDLRQQMVRMLCCDVIHGDLSPYNILWASAGATIIDFPQAVYASQNSNAERFFLRDARNILEHFAELDPRLRAHGRDGAEIWRAYQRRELTPDFVPSGRPAFDAMRSFAPRSEDAASSPRSGGWRPRQNGSRENGAHFQPDGSRPRSNGGEFPRQNGGQFPRQNGGQFPRQNGGHNGGDFRRQNGGQFPRQNGGHNGGQFSRQNGARPHHDGWQPRQDGSNQRQPGSEPHQRGGRPERPTAGPQRQASRQGQGNAPARSHGRRAIREVVVLHKRPLARDVPATPAAPSEEAMRSEGGARVSRKLRSE